MKFATSPFLHLDGCSCLKEGVGLSTNSRRGGICLQTTRMSDRSLSQAPSSQIAKLARGMLLRTTLDPTLRCVLEILLFENAEGQSSPSLEKLKKYDAVEAFELIKNIVQHVVQPGLSDGCFSCVFATDGHVCPPERNADPCVVGW